MKKLNEKDIKVSKGKTNWTLLEKQTEEEINNAALSDPDARLLKDFELMKMKKPKK